MSGMAKRMESNRSSDPPCPGMRVPLSLIWLSRFMSDSTRSPAVPATADAVQLGPCEGIVLVLAGPG